MKKRTAFHDAAMDPSEGPYLACKQALKVLIATQPAVNYNTCPVQQEGCSCQDQTTATPAAVFKGYKQH